MNHLNGHLILLLREVDSEVFRIFAQVSYLRLYTLRLSTGVPNLRLYPENAMIDFRETWFVGSNKCYLRGVSLPNAHIKELICIFVLIGS